MKRQLTVLFCITGALALACSKDKPAESAYDTREETERPADETPLTPASSDGIDHSMDHSSGSATATPDTTTAPDTIPPRDSSDGGDSMRPRAPSTSPNTSSSPSSDPSSRPSDSAASGQRGSGSTGPTVGDQGQGQSDLDITQRIRQAVMKDSALSFTSKNVKIITKDGKVTLRGTVPSYEERLAIEDAAKKVAGAMNVTSEIEVKK